MGSPEGLDRLGRYARALHGVIGGVLLAWVILAIARWGADMSAMEATVFLALPFTLLLVSAYGSRARAERAVGLLLVLGSTLVGLYTLELALGLFPQPQPFAGVAEAMGASDTRQKVEVVADLREAGIRAFPEYSPWLLRGRGVSLGQPGFLPLAPAPARRRIVVCNEGEGWLTHETDRFGFRRALARAADSTPLGPRIVVLGDSFAFGQCVDREDSVAGLLAMEWPATQNLGVSGAGPLHELGVLTEYATLLEPELLFWFYFEGNDRLDLSDELRSPHLVRYLDDGFRLDNPHHQNEIDRWLEATLDSVLDETLSGSVVTPQRLDLGSAIVAGMKLSRLRSGLGARVTLPQRDPLGRLDEVLETGVERVRDWGGQVVLVYVPDYSRYTRFGAYGRAGYQDFLELAGEMEVTVIDLASRFEREPDPRALWVHPRGHLTPEGYAIAAVEMRREARRHLSVPR